MKTEEIIGFFFIITVVLVCFLSFTKMQEKKFRPESGVHDEYVQYWSDIGPNFTIVHRKHTLQLSQSDT